MTRRGAGMFLLLAGAAHAEVGYELHYTADRSGSLSVVVTPDQPVKTPIAFIVPRTYPGGYAELRYDDYVEDFVAQDADGKPLKVQRDPDGPRWLMAEAGRKLKSVRYEVSVARMEEGIVNAVSSSKVRTGYAGILGYSVFGYLEGFEGERCRLKVGAPPDWPVLLTLSPALPLPKGSAAGASADFYELADSQVLMGPKLSIGELPGKIPLFTAIYAEAPVDAALEGRLAREALDRVQGYFGDVPISSYVVGMEFLQPRVHHQYDFSQEHVASGSFSLSVDRALNREAEAGQALRTEFNFAHHMAHSWIPKRAYGEGYRPFNWEMEPVIETVWFNEGFGRYAAIEAMAEGMAPAEGRAFRDAQLSSLRAIVDSAPAFIARMPLEVLSREASFLYASDFRTGRNVFARGALMAAELDDRIRAQTGGQKSLRDALRWILNWCQAHHAAFASADLPGYFASATGVDVADIFKRWQRPLDGT